VYIGPCEHHFEFVARKPRRQVVLANVRRRYVAQVLKALKPGGFAIA
jgi:hypothetical protein